MPSHDHREWSGRTASDIAEMSVIHINMICCLFFLRSLLLLLFLLLLMACLLDADARCCMQR
eukprot:scaffold31979_cov148-Skeletonema_menzelii.AAC.1